MNKSLVIVFYPFSDSRESGVPSEVSIARSVGAAPELSIARSVPPDGSSFQQVQFQEKVATSIPPFGYLNLQFFHKVSSNGGRVKLPAGPVLFFPVTQDAVRRSGYNTIF